MSYHCNDTRLVPNKRHSIVEKDENGFIIGAYTGYWNPDGKSVALYPDWRHPAVKPGMKLVKRRVYDGLVRCKKASSTASGSTSQKGNAGAKSQTSGAMRDLIGQVKMKL